MSNAVSYLSVDSSKKWDHLKFFSKAALLLLSPVGFEALGILNSFQIVQAWQLIIEVTQGYRTLC